MSLYKHAQTSEDPILSLGQVIKLRNRINAADDGSGLSNCRTLLKRLLTCIEALHVRNAELQAELDRVVAERSWESETRGQRIGMGG